MLATDVTSSDQILVGDVVQDAATHKPLQVVGRELRTAGQIDSVWDSVINQEVYDIDQDDEVVECVYLPKGERVHVPGEIHHFPLPRLVRVPAESPGKNRRVQATIVQDVFAHFVADMRNDGYEKMADATVAKLHTFYDEWFVDGVRELADVHTAEGKDE